MSKANSDARRLQVEAEKRIASRVKKAQTSVVYLLIAPGGHELDIEGYFTEEGLFQAISKLLGYEVTDENYEQAINILADEYSTSVHEILVE